MSGKTAEAVFVSLAALLLAPFTLMWAGYVVSVLWAWFAVPVGLPNIGVAWAIGITVLVRLITWDAHAYDSSDKTPLVALCGALGAATIGPAIALAVGWAAHGFM